MLKWILAILLIAAAWAVVLVLELPEWIAIATTIVVIAFLLIMWMMKRLRARKAARELEKAIEAQAREHAQMVRPEMQAEIQAMQAEFMKAIGSLKTSKVGRGGAEALYSLPWYVIIGPPGAGKSTALRNSGLEFPYLSARGGGVRGVGGTRNCEWWLTNDSVILDTAGRYATEDDDREEWFSFLQMLRQYRPHKPIDGVIVGVPVSDLGGASEEEVVAMGRKLRERIDEIMGRLQMVVPVYVLFTKVDLVEGFVETFENLKKSERGQIWGFTLPIGKAAGVSPSEVFREKFDELARVVRGRSTRRIGEERRVEVRGKIYQFPQQFELLRDNLALFVGTVLQENVYQDTPIMRGVYFTSGTQEGRPIDRVMASMAEAFGIRRALSTAPPVVEAKSYFLRDVFANVIFKDSDLAVRSAEEVRRQRNRRYAFAAGAFGAAAIISIIPTVSFVKNGRLVKSTRDVVERVAEHRKNATGPISLERLEPLRQRVDELYRFEKKRPPLAMRFGLYAGGRLYPEVRDFYTGALRVDLLEPIVRRDEGELDDFGRRYEATEARPTTEEYTRTFDRLKMHLVLTTPKAQGEPSVRDGNLRKWTSDQIVDRWSANEVGAGGRNVSDGEKAAMGANARLYLELLAGDPKLAFPRNVPMVTRARLPLTTVPIESLALERLIMELEQDGFNLTLTHMLGGAVGPLRSGATVRGAFTRRGWETKVRQRLSSAPLGDLEAWVLGTTPTESKGREEQLKKIRSQYFAMYIQEWQQFVESVRVMQPGNDEEALTTLQDLTRGEPPPLGRMMRALAYNVTLEEEADKSKEKQGAGAKLLQSAVVNRAKRKVGMTGGRAIDLALAGGGGKGQGGEDLFLEAEDVAAYFDGFTRFGVPPESSSPPAPGAGPPPKVQVDLDVYQEQLAYVRDALVDYQENPEEGEGPLLQKLQSARTRTTALVESQEVGWRPRFEALLWPPIEGSSTGSVSSVASGKGSKWCSDVVALHGRTLGGRYPFDPNGHDAALADVADFYRPTTGVLWAFFEKSLKADVLRVGDAFQLARRLGQKPRFNDRLIAYLNQALEASTVLFPPGSKDIATEFDVRIRPTPDVALITVTIDGQIVEYHNGPEQWQTLKWPGPGKERGASVRVRGKGGVDETIEQEGEWGLFRLIEAGTVRGDPRSRVFSVAWHLRTENMDLVVDIRPARSESPFFGAIRPGKTRFLGPFRGADAVPPGVIATTGGACPVGR